MRILPFLWAGYILYIFYQVYDWYKEKHVAVDVSIYNIFFLKKIVIPITVLLISFICYRYNKIKTATWIAGVPVLLMSLMIFLGVCAWIFTWFAMSWGK
jgi:ABC-type xylose transport system permease subunit